MKKYNSGHRRLRRRDCDGARYMLLFFSVVFTYGSRPPIQSIVATLELRGLSREKRQVNELQQTFLESESRRLTD